MLEKNGARFSLPIRWTLILATVVIVTMILGLVATHRTQQETITALTFDYGHSLAEFIATENAELVLLEDWVGIQVIVEQIEKRKIIYRLSIADYNDIIRGSTDTTLVDKPYQLSTDAELLAVRDNTRIYGTNLSTGETVFQFVSPIMFKDIEVGKVYLDLVQPLWQRATSLTVLTALIQTVLILVAIIVMGYILYARYTRPLGTLERALSKLANGHHEYRIKEQRTDEWGPLFRLCNQTAENLKKTEDEKFALLAGTLPSEAATQVTSNIQSADFQEEKETQMVDPNAAKQTSETSSTEDSKSAIVTSPTVSAEQLSPELTPEQTAMGSDAEEGKTQVIPANAAFPFGQILPQSTSDDESNEATDEATQEIEADKLSLSKYRKQKTADKNGNHDV